MTYMKFYDDYERGTWLISPVNDNGIIIDGIITVDGLTGPQADEVCAALNNARALADELEPWLSLARSLDLRMERMRAAGGNVLADITFTAEALSCLHGLAAALSKWEASHGK